MAITEFNAAVSQIAAERGISVESVLESIETALISAYRKDYGEGLETESEGDSEVEITAKLDPLTGEAKILKAGKDVTPTGFGRIAAQTAKQVIFQKIRETEKDMVLAEYSEKLGTIVSGNIFRTENDVVVIDLGKAHGILLPSEQVPEEEYRLGQRLRVLILKVRDTKKGPEVLVSRTTPQFVSKLFEQEVPEIASEVVKIEAIAREPGSRTKMAVSSNDERVDPVGSCVGQKGVRVQSVIAELSGEKIDIVPFLEDTAKFIAAALSPARVTDVALDMAEKKATVSVPEDQQSLAIGKAGQNARLANKLTGWKIDIKGAEGFFDNENGNFVPESLEPAIGIWDSLIQKVKETPKEDEDAGIESEVDEEGSEAEENIAPSEETEPEEEGPSKKTPEESVEEKTTDTAE